MKTQTVYALAAVALAGCTLTPGQIGKLVADLGPDGGQAGAGSLAVTVNLSQRSTQALVSGISTVSISVQDASKSETVSDGSAGLASGVASASFADLVPGPGTVSATVLDASGSVIGSGQTAVTIASGSTAALGVGVASQSVGASPNPAPSVSPYPLAVITSVVPNSAHVGDTVTIYGENFLDPGLFGACVGAFEHGCQNSGSVGTSRGRTNGIDWITIVVPPNASSGDVQVMTNAGTAFGPAFTLLP